MFDGVNGRRVFESFCSGDSAHNGVTGRQGFVNLVRDQLGLTYDRANRPRVVNPRFLPSDFHIRELAESICGYEWVKSLEPGRQRGYQVLEAGPGVNTAVTPGMLPNVSAFLGSVTGLLEAQILTAYQKPEFIADRIFFAIPSKTRQMKLIGTGRIGDASRRRNPGESHARAQFGERYSITPETYNDALAVDVTFEAVFFDQTHEVLERARSVGDELGLRKEFDCFDVLAGIVNPYNYNGTSYNTYLTGGGNWINDHDNSLVDWTSLDAARMLFSRMTDQETGNRIVVTPNLLVVSPARVETANYIQGATENETRTQTASEIRRGPNREGKRYEVLSSPILDQRLTDPLGGNLSQADADDRWWMAETGKEGGAYVYIENWGMTTETAAADSYTARDHKLMLSVFADQMGTPMVGEPRKTVRNK